MINYLFSNDYDIKKSFQPSYQTQHIMHIMHMHSILSYYAKVDESSSTEHICIARIRKRGLSW